MARTHHPRGKRVHGFAVQDHPFYDTWANMLARCLNPKSASYPNYGGRGIRVCERWTHFENFAHDMWPRQDDTLTLNRIDNDGHYEPGNCEWASRTDQCVNRRTFRNNTTGARGVVKVKRGYHARFDYEGVRHEIGRFDSLDEAAARRAEFVELFFSDRVAALASISGTTVRRNSSTRVPGVTKAAGGRFIARVTLAGTRHYLGYFASVEAAEAACKNFVARKFSNC